MLKLEEPATAKTCAVSGEPFVRSLTFIDRNPPTREDFPVQVSSGFLFDDDAPTARIHTVDFTTGPGQALMAVLYVDPEYVAAPFVASDGTHVPAGIAGRVFCCPPLTDHPWEVVELPEPGNAAQVGEWVRCTVYVASVEVR